MKEVLRLEPVLKNYLWGGNRLFAYGKGSNDSTVAESWELSMHPNGEVKVQGKPLSSVVTTNDLGEHCARFSTFPVLTKFIDARDRLSVQVHPSDDYAMRFEGQLGKTEMWYVVEATEGAGLYLGFNATYSLEQIERAAQSGDIEGMLNFVPVKAKDVFFIPAGTVHAIGSGVLIYEIQQNSNLTYRLYDYMRRDGEGKLRELHVDKALAVLHPNEYIPLPRDKKSPEIIGACEYFTASKYKLKLTNLKLFVDDSSFLAVTCVSGSGCIEEKKIEKGDTYFVPASYGELLLSTESEMEIITVRV